MLAGQFTIHHELHPSDRLAASASSTGVPAEAIMRDYVAIDTHDDLVVVAVGDMANNLSGGTHQHPELALSADLPRDYRLNGGLVGALALKRSILFHHDFTGPKVVDYANRILGVTYAQLELGSAADLDPAEWFTGYLTHVHFTPEITTITSVGDVNAWVNGDHVAGAEKPVDTSKDELISNLTAVLGLDEDLRPRHFSNIISVFNARAAMDHETTRDLYTRLLHATSSPEPLDRQTVYRPVDNIVTAWQIRNLQNRPSSEHLWAYGAIDGTTTPDEYVHVHPIPTADIETVVIATDGSRPARPDAAVTKASDLEAVNREFNEQAVVTVTRTARAA